MGVEAHDSHITLAKGEQKVVQIGFQSGKIATMNGNYDTSALAGSRITATAP